MNDRDPQFVDKAVAIIDLLLSPPTDGPLFCVDEKPGIGVRQPSAPDQPPVPRPLGQLLEYAFWPKATAAERLIVAGEPPLDAESQQYLAGLASRFKLPVYYEQITM